MEYSRYFQEIYPSQGTPSHTNSRDKESLNSSTQAKPSHAKLGEQLEEQCRQGAAVQPYPVIAQPHQLHLCSTAVAEEQQQRSSTEEQQACSSSREAEEHLSGMCVA